MGREKAYRRIKVSRTRITVDSFKLSKIQRKQASSGKQLECKKFVQLFRVRYGCVPPMSPAPPLWDFTIDRQ